MVISSWCGSGAKNELGETPAEWAKRFEPGGKSRLIRYWRPVNAKYTRERDTRKGGGDED